MPKKISVNEPIFDDSEVNIAQTILDSGLLSSSNIYGGKYVKIFEKQLSELLDCKYAVAVNSGTSALYASLLSLGIKSGDEVLFHHLALLLLPVQLSQQVLLLSLLIFHHLIIILIYH